jgi:hypothetical protein
MTMSDLGALQASLKKDGALRKEFLTDPAKVLTGHGLTLDKDQLASLTKQLQAHRTGANAANVDVGVGVSVKF